MKLYASARLEASFVVDVAMSNRVQSKERTQIIDMVKKYDGKLLQEPTKNVVRFSVGSRGDAEGAVYEINDRFGANSQAEYYKR